VSGVPGAYRCLPGRLERYVIRIVTDTDSNMPQNVVDEYNVVLVPIQIIFGDEVLLERFELTDAEAYERMGAADELPKTSQPSVGQFKEAYERILSDDPGATILSIHISGAMSGTIESARQAARLFPDADAHFFDTRSVSVGQALMVLEAARMAREGTNVEAIMERLAVMRDNMHVYFVLSTLDYLAKGGRIGRASHLMGTLLEIKPILILKDGAIDAHSRHRTWSRAVRAVRGIIEEDVRAHDGIGRVHLGVAHAVSEEEARSVSSDLIDVLRPAVFIFGEVGPGLGVHTGPGALGICWYTPEA
jgi:DegV family protein with EDD domain